MATFAIVTNRIRSTAHTAVELARRLREAGHDATVICQADLDRLATHHRVPFVRLTADEDAFDELRTRRRAARRFPRWGSVGAIVGLPAAAWRGRRRTAAADELHAVLDRLDPDLVVVDTECHVAVVAAVASGRPVALTTFLFTIERRPGVPPISSTLLPGDPGIDDAWRAALAEPARSIRRRLVDRFAPISYHTTSLVALRAVARRHGVRLDRFASGAGWLRPVWYPTLPTLTTNLPELEFGHDHTPGWTYVGPMVLDGGTGPDVDDESRRRWERLLAARAAVDGPPRLVYCSFGTYLATDPDLLGRMIACFADHPDWQLVVGLGGRRSPVADVPPNVALLEWAPQPEILAHADAAIVHGGNATLNECIAAGVPMVACSTGALDQHGVCARIEAAGVGRRIERSASPDRIAAAVDAVCTDDALAARVRELRAIAASPERRDVAVRLLERLARVSR